MIKNIYIVLFGLLLSMGVASCDNNTDLLFDESAAERKMGANKEHNDALKSSEQGWLFQYYPEETQKYGGYNFVVKFAEDDQVTVWSENMDDLTMPETSTYDIISYGGPVLTFNTYNSIMHEFANPSAAEYLAKGGDFEFLIMSNENDMMTVKCIKTGNVLRMTKMTETAEVYLSKVTENVDFIGQGSFDANVNGTKVSVQEMNRNFTFNYAENDEIKSVTAPYIVTDSGLSFYEPVEMMGQTFQDFTLNKESYQLISNEGDMKIIIIVPPIDLKLAAWYLDVSAATDRSEVVLAGWQAAYDANDQAWGEQLASFMAMGAANATYGDYGISFYSYPGPYRAHYNLAFGGVAGHSDYLDIVKLSAGFNWNWYTHLSVMVDLLADNSPYIVEIDDPDAPMTVKLTSANNPDVWFIIRQ
tara:strand:+ start:10386 stop:11633 length:1248 start_codon:yes stop_codon:yes gene_type:complete